MSHDELQGFLSCRGDKMAAPLPATKPFRFEPRIVKSKPSSTPAPLLKRDELYQMGKALRNKCPRKSHANWKAPANRPDAVQLNRELCTGSKDGGCFCSQC